MVVSDPEREREGKRSGGKVRTWWAFTVVDVPMFGELESHGRNAVAGCVYGEGFLP